MAEKQKDTMQFNEDRKKFHWFGPEFLLLITSDCNVYSRLNFRSQVRQNHGISTLWYLKR